MDKAVKTVLVLGAGGFIGSHLVKKLRAQGHWVRGVDLKWPEFSDSAANEFLAADLRNPRVVEQVMMGPKQLFYHDKDMAFDEVYQLAADMGGAGYIFTGENDADVMSNSALININVAKAATKCGVRKLFYSSSACIYPQELQTVDKIDYSLKENDAYPANPDSEYGWEKIFSERLYMSYFRNHGLDVRIARFHNIFGPESCYENGKEKAPAAICRKIAKAKPGEKVIIWGSGTQTRSFLYIDECLEGIELLMKSEYRHPVNIGSDEMISINDLARMVSRIANKPVEIVNGPGPVGVMGRNSNNNLVYDVLGWRPTQSLEVGMQKLYSWIKQQIDNG